MAQTGHKAWDSTALYLTVTQSMGVVVRKNGRKNGYWEVINL